MNLSPIKVWSKLSGSSSTDIAHAMSIGLDGSIYISGLASGILDGQTSKGAEDAFLTKYSTDGTKVWTKLLGTNAKDYALATATGLDGAIYIAGVTYGALDGQANSGDGDAFLTKYRTDGSKVWTTLLGGRLYDAAQGITVGLDGSIYITGQTLNSLDGQTNKGGADAFLTKYSSDGIKVWTKLLGTSEQTSSNFLGGKSWDEGHALTTGTDGSIYIADSVQCGYGRSGIFFSHDCAGVEADIYSMAKGMGNGFPIGGIIVSPKFKAKHSMLGTTFGGNHLACAAALAVLEVMQKESLMENAKTVGDYLMNELKLIPQISGVRGRGLMIGFDIPDEYKNLKKDLLFKYKIFTGEAKPNVIRLLPSLALNMNDATTFISTLKIAITAYQP